MKQFLYNCLEVRRKIYWQTREFLTMYKMSHSKADIDKLYVKEKREEGACDK
jgi:hypothetical protein